MGSRDTVAYFLGSRRDFNLKEFPPACGVSEFRKAM